MIIKDFETWNPLKQKLHKRQTIPFFREREIWWCSIGVNIGCEEDGKNSDCNRPVVILRKFSKSHFYAIPLTKKSKTKNPYYFKVTFQGKESSALTSQVRAYDAKRLGIRMGRLSNKQFRLLREEVKNMF